MDINKKILAFTLALLLIAILLIALISGLGKQKQQEKEKEIQSTQTAYIILEDPNYFNQVHNKYSYSDVYESQHEKYYEHYREASETVQPQITGDFSYFGKEIARKEFLGNYVVEYQVYVLNKGNTGRYFTVTFNFKTQEGFEYSEAITQYLKAGEKKEFLYKDVQFERTEILSWSYKVERV